MACASEEYWYFVCKRCYERNSPGDLSLLKYGCRTVAEHGQDSVKVLVTVNDDNFLQMVSPQYYFTLLQREEEICKNILQQKCNGMYLVKHTEDQFTLYLKGLSSDQKLYAMQTCDHVEITVSTGIKLNAFLLKDETQALSDDALYVKYYCDDAEKFAFFHTTQETFDINFKIKSSYFGNLYNILKKISDKALIKVFPCYVKFEDELSLVAPKKKFLQHHLDEDQYSGLQKILSTKLPVLICGPYGSGKTHLLSVASNYIISESAESDNVSRILFCCYQQHSLKNIIKNVIFKEKEENNVICVISQSYQDKYGHGHTKKSLTNIDDFIQKSNLDDFFQMKQLIVVTTFDLATIMSDVIPADFFTHIFIDEAGQRIELESLGPLLLAHKCTQIVIAGDIYQAGSTLSVFGPQQNEFKETLVHRLYTEYINCGSNAQEYIVMLRHNYCCHKDILELLSTLFYDSNFVSYSSIKCHPGSIYPLKFVCSSIDKKNSNQCVEECSLLLSEVTECLKYKEYTVKDMCIVTSSSVQAKLIKVETGKNKALHNLNICTSHEIQGQEYSLLFVSTFEAIDSNDHPIGTLTSLCHPSVFYKTLSRAKSLVVAFGNPFVLMMSDCWREFLTRCINNENFYIPDFLCSQVNKSDLLTIIKTKAFSKPMEDFTSHMSKMDDITLCVPAKSPLAHESFAQWPDFENVIQKDSKKIVGTNIQKAIGGIDSFLPSSTELKKAKQKSNKTKSKGTSSQTIFQKDRGKKIKSATFLRNTTSRLNGNSSSLPSPKISKRKNSKSKRKHKNIFKNANRLDMISCRFSAPFNASINNKQCGPEVLDIFESFQDMLITKQAKQSTIKSFRHRKLKEEIKYDIPSVLSVSLCHTKYQENFHHLLSCQEKKHKCLISQRCDGIYSVKVFHANFVPSRIAEYTRYGCLFGKNMKADVISYLKQITPGKHSVQLNYNVVVQAEIVKGKISGKEIIDTILIAFRMEEIKKIIDVEKMVEEHQFDDVEVTFIFDLSHFDQMHEALDNLSPQIIERLTPKHASEFTESNATKPHSNIEIPESFEDLLELDDASVNGSSQMNALSSILTCQPHKASVLIIGSFGTGKTRLLARAAYHILVANERHRVLICTHHSHSADIYITEYFAKMNSTWKYEQNYPNPICLTFDNYKVPKSYYMNIDEFREHHSRLAITTFFTSFCLLKRISKGFFTHILIDEGAQSIEPETIIPLCLADNQTQIIIAGDHKQVGPSSLEIDDAIEDGLDRSLLERLHDEYKKFGDSSNKHCNTLLGNFKRHPIILSLLSYLFYESTLIISEKSPIMKLHPKIQFPLHFICSSVSEVKEELPSMCSIEVELLLVEVLKYVNDWPNEWKEKDLKKIGIIATTFQQKLLIESTINLKYKELSEIKILMTNNILGQEFEAVFLSTVESTTNKGKSNNLTMTTCNPYIFNTVLSRARSLVVCFGNPFLLMTIEGKEILCWKEYIRRCMIARTFIIPHNITVQDNCTRKLQEAIFGTNHASRLSNSDSITSAYKKAIQVLPYYQECVDHITKLGTSFNESSDDEYKTVECELRIYDHYAEAFPCSNSHESIRIVGRKQRKGAFDCDIVKVKYLDFKTLRSDNRKYGQVVSIIKSKHPTKIVCQNNSNIYYFQPLEKFIPIIYNLPSISKKAITVYCESSLQFDCGSKDIFPHIKELIPCSIAQSLLFVVKVLGWSFEGETLLGAVIETIPRTSNIGITEKLLKIAFDIDDSEISSDELPKRIDSDDVPHYNRAFTIDECNTINMDDAISLVQLNGKGRYELGIHISNVAKYITKDNIFDKSARRKKASVYGRGLPAKHMLPVNLSTQLFSLQYNKTCDVLSILGNVIVKDDKVMEVNSTVSKNGPQKAKLTSQAQLTYQAAQRLLDNKQIESTEMERQIEAFDSTGLTMAETVKLLYKIAIKLKEDRQGMLYPDEEESECWQSHLLVSELMIWTNSLIAEYLCNNLQDIALIRRQLPPSQEDHRYLQSRFESVIPYYLPSKTPNFNISEEHVEPLVVTNEFVSCLLESFQSRNFKKFIWTLTNYFLFPQLTQAHDFNKKIQNPAEYIPIEGLSGKELSHFSLSVKPYTHFTCPIRRYFDLLVQRFVNALLEGADITYQVEELREICSDLNRNKKSIQNFEKKVSSAIRVQKCETSLLKYEGFITKKSDSSQEKITFQLLFLDEDSSTANKEIDNTFKLAHLNIYKNEEDIDKYQWRIVSAVLEDFDPMVDFCSSKFIPKEEAVMLEKNDYQIKAIGFKYLPEKGVDKEGQRMNYRRYLASLPVTTHLIDYCEWKKVREEINDCMQTRALKPMKEFVDNLPFSIVANNSEICQPKDLRNSPFIIFDIIRHFKSGDKLTALVGKSITNPYPTPCIQLLEVAPNVQVCLQHNRSPPRSFTDIQQASRSSYHSIDEYINLWNRVLIAETSHICVKDVRTLNLLRKVLLQWPELVRVDNCVDTMHYEPVKNDSISFTVSKEKNDTLQYIKIKVGDLICTRYNVTTDEGKYLCALYHFIVTRKSQKEDCNDMHIEMKPMGNSQCWIAEEIKPYIETEFCDLQIITMPVSFKRIFTFLQSGLLSSSGQRQQNTHNNNLKYTFEVKRLPMQVKPKITEGVELEKRTSKWSDLAVKIALGLRDKDLHLIRCNSLDWLEKLPFALKLWEPPHTNLNEGQINAVKSALETPFKLIQGPPGTGKSIVGAHLAYLFSRINSDTNQSVLYCCPSNKAIDVVHKKLKLLNKKLDHFDQLKIIRLYGHTHERIDYPNPCYDICQFGTEMERNNNHLGKCLKKLQDDALHFKIRKRNPRIEDSRKLFLELVDQGMLPSLKEREEYKSLIKQAENEELSEKYDIILSTCNEVSSGRLFHASKNSRIAQCIIDECGMANEPETIAVASLCEHVILIGDHLQLQPIVKYSGAKKNGLNKSLFERYTERKDSDNLLIQLKCQYRMHETICVAPSELFYGGTLETSSNVLKRKPFKPLNTYWKCEKHVAIYDVVDDSNNDHHQAFSGDYDMHSKSNPTEAFQVLEVAYLLHRKYEVSYDSIAVLTPYAAQKDLITKTMSEDQRFKDAVLKVTTIIESQGDEHNIVILTTVRSLPLDEIEDSRLIEVNNKWKRDNLGFLTDRHQINVGITRAKHGLIIIGNKTLLNYDSTWEKFFSMYKENLMSPLPVTFET